MGGTSPHRRDLVTYVRAGFKPAIPVCKIARSLDRAEIYYRIQISSQKLQILSVEHDLVWGSVSQSDLRLFDGRLFSDAATTAEFMQGLMK